MSKIGYAIPPANFELIRDAIVDILNIELPAQAGHASNPLIDATVWKERFTPFAHNELPAIRVYFARAVAVADVPDESTYEETFNIEIHTNAKSTESQDGDQKSSEFCTELTRIVRYILKFPEYETLLLDREIIQKLTIDSIASGTSTQPDATHSAVALISITVKTNEKNGTASTELSEGTDITIGKTKITQNN